MKYKNFSKELKKELRKAERTYFHNLFDSKINNTKSIWRNLNKIFSKGGRKENVVDEIVINGSSVSEPVAICTHFNEYFCSVGNDLSKNSLKESINYKNYLKSPIANSFFCEDVSMNELESVIISLKSSKSSLGDSMSSFLLQKCSF